MNNQNQQTRPVLYVIICAAPPAQQIQELIQLARERQWEVCAIATPQATRFIDAPLLTRITGYPVRSDYKRVGEADALPKADAIVVMPATFNTINKWALGIADTLAVSLLCEATGKGTPIVAVPYLKADLAHHPAFPRSLELLRQYGVHVLYEPEKYPPSNNVPWQVILEKLCLTDTSHQSH